MIKLQLWRRRLVGAQACLILRNAATRHTVTLTLTLRYRFTTACYNHRATPKTYAALLCTCLPACAACICCGSTTCFSTMLRTCCGGV